MKTIRTKKLKVFLLFTFLSFLSNIGLNAQNKIWTFQACIDYALNENIEIKQANLSINRNQLNQEQAKAAKLPSLNGNLNKNLSWNKNIDSTTGEYSDYENSNSTNYSISSSLILFNGMKLKNQEKQTDLELKSSQYNSETIKESIELNILSAFLQILYAEENVSNAEKQIEATEQQLFLAKERVELGMVSQSDYLQIKSELASEKLTLANAKSTLSIAKVNLMQLMELPADSEFEIARPNIEILINQDVNLIASEIYKQALLIKPQIVKSELDIKSAQLDEKIAKASQLPSLTLDAGIGTNYSNLQTNFNYTEQLKNQITPSVGLSLSIPIFQKKQIKTNVGLAKIGILEAELEDINTKNSLRKEIEQATVDANSAQMEYQASLEQYEAVEESNKVANEKYEVGLLNSVDYLFEKTNLITAESKLLQSKFNLIFSYKILDFYKGTPLTL